MTHESRPEDDLLAERLTWSRTSPARPIPAPDVWPLIRFPSTPDPFDAPMRVEADIVGIECIQGEVPAHLDGTYFKAVCDRQYPKAVPEGPLGAFNDDGMAISFRFHKGRVDYKSRFIRTPRFEAERAAGRSLFGYYRNPLHDDPLVEGVVRGIANTNLVYHAGKLYASKEDAPPIIIDPETLETIGHYDFGGAFTSQTATAHPKIDPRTGELVFFGYAAKGETTRDIAYYEADANGDIVHETWFKAPYSCMIHDFAVTQNYVVFPVIPLRSELAWLEAGESTFQWDPQEKVHLGVIPRKGRGDKAVWYEGPNRFASHIMGAYDDGRRIYIDTPVSHSSYFPWFPIVGNGEHDPERSKGYLSRWTIDLAGEGRSFTETRLSNVPSEFPRMDDRYETLTYQWGLMGLTERPGHDAPGRGFRWVATIDHRTGAHRLYYPGDRATVGEPIFVQGDENAPEGHGYVFVIVSRRDLMHSELVILDAQDVDGEPVCTLKIPLRIPRGLHGNWVTAEELARRD
ncbi:carotenoid oxygenase family protein [Microbacterium sp. 18062]|uniref:carotenoid oxygenase family protein n=1 Tax=Microbacterium sp. 18062 TaxID=2681410 RepID=UPI0013575DBD|nr:carotenoid oxygenase family protein [Microbacterium sp. 18062]